MLQQSATLCIALTRLAQWPNLSRNGPWTPLRAGGKSLLRKISVYPTFNFSSTMAHTQKINKEPLDQEMPQNASISKTQQGSKTVQSAIDGANTLNELLELVDSRTMSGDNLRDLVYKLAEWEKSGKIKDKDFQNDPRFIQAQKMLHKPTLTNRTPSHSLRLSTENDSVSPDGELRAVLKVKSLSKAIDLSQGFNWVQRLSVLKNLAGSNHRPLPLINNLANGLSKDLSKFNMKDITDLLYSMSKLNYMNVELLDNACKAMKIHLKNTSKHAVVGSAITSLRKLNFRDEELLEELAVWLENNHVGFNSPSSLVYTLALQNYLPSNHKTLFDLLWNNFKSETKDYNEAVSLVWSFLVLQCATEEQVSFILNPTFIRDLEFEPVWVPTLKKLLNLNAAAQTLFPNYQGAQLPDDLIEHQAVSESTEKRVLISRISDFLFRKMDSNLYATSVPTKMGFSIDLVCNLDKEGSSLPLSDTSPGASRVAVMALTYRECCEPNHSLTGFKVLEKRLLESQGFKVIEFPFHVFSSDKTSKYAHNFFKAALQGAFTKKS